MAKMAELTSDTSRKRSISAVSGRVSSREACETEELDAATAADLCVLNFFLENDFAFRAVESEHLHK